MSGGRRKNASNPLKHKGLEKCMFYPSVCLLGLSSLLALKAASKMGKKENPEVIEFQDSRDVVVATGLEPVTPSM